MPDQPRSPDYLHTFGRLGQRVSNLETGVHPVIADVDFFDSVDWTPISVISGTGFSAFGWRWRKRVGIVMMDGGVREASGGNGAFLALGSGGVKLATLPAAARPTATLHVPVIISYGSGAAPGPFLTGSEIRDNGDVYLYNLHGVSSVGPFYFDGTTYTPA